MIGYIYIFLTIIFTVYGQLILKWRINYFGVLPDNIHEKSMFFLKLVMDPFIISGFFSAIIASVFWIAAMTKFDVSFAYPFMSAAFIFVLILSVVFFKEPLTWHKIVGLFFIVLGIIITSNSK